MASRWSFAPRHMLDTLADWWGLQRHCGGIGGRACSRLNSPFPGTHGGRGHTCRTLPRAGPINASRIACRKGAHDRVFSDRAIHRSRCEADHFLSRKRLEAILRKLPVIPGLTQAGAIGPQSLSGQQAARPVGSGALVVSVKAPRPGSTSRTRCSPKRRPTPLPPGQSVCCCCPHTC